MGGACSTHGRDDKYKILVCIPVSKRQLGRSKHRYDGTALRLILGK